MEVPILGTVLALNCFFYFVSGTQSSVRLFECSSQTDFTCALLFSNGYGLCDDTSGPEEDKYGTPEKKAVIAVTLPQRMTKQDFFQ